MNQLASAKNPEIRSALAEMRAANAGVLSARAAYLPDLALNFNYGIDAPQFATHGRPNDVKNLGYSISGTVDLPVWDWFSTQKRVKQSEIQRDVAKVTLTAAQRRLIATLEETYREAAAARDQLDLLDQSVRLAAESLRLTKLRYPAGEATVLEVVDAQSAFLSAETAQADGAVRYQTAFACTRASDGNPMTRTTSTSLLIRMRLRNRATDPLPVFFCLPCSSRVARRRVTPKLRLWSPCRQSIPSVGTSPSTSWPMPRYRRWHRPRSRRRSPRRCAPFTSSVVPK